MAYNWTREQKVISFCFFLPIALMIGTVAYITDSIAEKAGLLGLLVAYGGLIVVVVSQRQDAEDRKTRHEQIIGLLEKDIAVREEGNRLLGQLIGLQERH